jgi:hypothetical protein
MRKRYFDRAGAPASEARHRVLDDPRVDKSEECWLWMGSRTTLGYGRLGDWYIHRLVFEQEVGPATEHVLHSCDNPPCCNPSHLFFGTQADNMQDAHRKGRLNTSNLWRRGEWTHCMRGHEFTPENTYIYPSGRRECRICMRDRHRRRKESQ